MQMKGYADNKRYVKISDIQKGDLVLFRRQAVNKATPAYETEPLQVQYRKGTRVVRKRTDGSTITRNTAYFKKVPFRSAEVDLFHLFIFLSSAGCILRIISLF